MRFAVLTLALGSAPLQCASDPEPADRPYETPPQALYALAKHFRARGDLDAWRTTLDHIIARYPNSRYARMAKEDVAASEGDAENEN